MGRKRDITNQIEEDMVAISENRIMDEIQDRREENEGQT